jgi:peptidoglycan/LPS O-acetylase OafA/YrhL
VKIDYRPEIDGLRAISVLAVIFYHAEFAVQGRQLFSGGFLGVDVFFVISGFLITSLLLQEQDSTGTISFNGFYERRARRLLPVLLVVALASLPPAWLLLYPQQLLDFAKSLLASLFFVSNFYWYSTLQVYGAESALLKPLLHTWSLAVEEQYYFIYPVILVVLSGISSHKRSVALFILGIASFGFAYWMSSVNPSLAFYMLPTRLWELLAGGLLAIHSTGLASRMNRLAHLQLPAFGLVLIVFSFCFLDASGGHPGPMTLLPVIGTMLIIAGAHSGCYVTRALAHPRLVFIGLLSYSLYLWHYPIFAFGRIYSSAPGSMEKLLWMVLSAGFSLLSYYLVEKPYRRRERRSTVAFLCATAIATGLLVGFAALVIRLDGIDARFEQLKEAYALNDFDNARLGKASWGPIWKQVERSGFETIEKAEKQALWFSEGNDRQKLLIVGNSHSKDTYNTIALNPGFFPNIEVARFNLQVGAGPAALQELVASPNFRHADTIVISSRYREKAAEFGLDGRRRGDLEALPELIELLHTHGKRVVLVSNTVEFQSMDAEPLFDWYMKSTMKGSGFYPEQLKRLFYRHRDQARYHSINERLREIAEREDVVFLDKEELICDAQAAQCEGITPAGYKAFYDYGHMTLEGARHFGRRMAVLGWFVEREPL